MHGSPVAHQLADLGKAREKRKIAITPALTSAAGGLVVLLMAAFVTLFFLLFLHSAVSRTWIAL